MTQLSDRFMTWMDAGGTDEAEWRRLVTSLVMLEMHSATTEMQIEKLKALRVEFRDMSSQLKRMRERVREFSQKLGA